MRTIKITISNKKQFRGQCFGEETYSTVQYHPLLWRACVWDNLMILFSQNKFSHYLWGSKNDQRRRERANLSVEGEQECWFEGGCHELNEMESGS